MNKGFFFYLHRSWSVTSFAYKRLNFIKKIELTLFLLVCYFGSLFFFLRPIFSIALTNAARMIEESHNLSVSKCFEGITKNARFKELFIARLYVFLLGLIIVALFFVIDIPFIFFPHAFSDFNKPVIISTIAIAALLTFVVEIRYLPLPYVASSTINTSAGDMLLNVRKTKLNVVRTELLLIIVFALLAIIFPVGFFGGGILIKEMLFRASKYYFWLAVAFYVFGLISLFFPFAFFMIMLHVSLYELYKDTVSIKKVYVVKEIAGTEITYASIFPTESDEVELIKEEKMGGLK